MLENGVQDHSHRGCMAEGDAYQAFQPKSVESLGLFVATSPWVDYGAAFAGMYITRFGRLVVMDGLVKRTSDLDMAAGTTYAVGTVPAGLRPTHDVLLPSVLSFSGGASIVTCRLRIQAANGQIDVASPTAGTLATTGWLCLAGQWRAAA